MSDWHITGSKPSASLIDAAMEMATGGLVSRPTEYEITNEETGEVKHSFATGEEQLGENIKNGHMH